MPSKMPLFSLLFLLFTPPIPSTLSLIPPPNSTEFIRTSCSATLYPVLCYASLARYAETIHQDPVHLARAAANLTLSHVRSLSSHVSLLCQTPTRAVGPAQAAALRDCNEVLGDAVDQVARSVEEIRKLETAVGPEIALRVSNVQTWMSAALTNEETCVDGFERVGPGTVKDDVCGQVRRAREYTSNALALVNILVASQ